MFNSKSHAMCFPTKLSVLSYITRIYELIIFTMWLPFCFSNHVIFATEFCY